MLVHGPGGTGKSKIIGFVTQTIAARGGSKWLKKGAYTGIAASLIGGSTIHSLTKMSVNKTNHTSEIIVGRKSSTLQGAWADVKYLIVDEISMISQKFIHDMSFILTHARPESKLPFGGISVLAFGDFHQFPPVGGSALYWTSNPSRDTAEKMIGRKLYEQFETVVVLEQQMRSTDNRWTEFLDRLRMGDCNRSDRNLVESLTIGSDTYIHADLTSDSWANAVLITPRNSVRHAWNSKAVRKHCQINRQRLYKVKARDSVGGRELTLEEQSEVVEQFFKGRLFQGKQRRKNKRKADDFIEVAIGMKVMITQNICTDADIANGSRGTIIDIILDEREPTHASDACEIYLTFQPAYVLVRLEGDRSKKVHLSDLDVGVVPITPRSTSFKAVLGNECPTITRMQLPITPAYAFTDYRGQGQSLRPVLVDAHKTTNGKLSAFNIYVACSRAVSRDMIRFVREVDWSKFTHHPCEHLRKEDARIDELARKTQERWRSELASTRGRL